MRRRLSFFSAIGGNQHHIISLVRHSRDFDFHSEFQLDAKCGAEIIPQSQIKSLILHFMSKDLRKLERLRASTNLEIFHLCAPPPKADEAFILKHAGLTFKRAGIDSFGINPASFRLKVWRLQCEVLRESLERLNIRLVPPPIDGITPEGFLDPAFYADDATHANLDYGVLLVRQISEIVRGSPVAAGRH